MSRPLGAGKWPLPILFFQCLFLLVKIFFFSFCGPERELQIAVRRVLSVLGSSADHLAFDGREQAFFLRLVARERQHSPTCPTDVVGKAFQSSPAAI
jgi:hypothetical protein